MNSPKDLFVRVFAELERRNIPYVILHSYENFPEEISSDVDYAVRDADLLRALRLQREVAEQNGWLLAQILQHEICAFYSPLVDPDLPGQSLKLDVCSHYVRNRCLLLRDTFLLEGRRKFRGFYVPAPAVEFAYTLAKVFAKEKDIAPFLPRLRQLWRMDPDGSQRAFDQLLGERAPDLAGWLEGGAQDWKALAGRMHARHRYSPAQHLQEFGRLARRLLRPTGLHLAILGPDGAGKSLLISRLQEMLEPCFRRQHGIHFCPMLFRTRPKGPASDPHVELPRSTVVSWIKVFYHFLDHWAGFLLEQLPAKIRSTCILFDRNFDDILIDSRRYRIQRSAPLVRLLRRLLPRADRTFVLEAGPELLRSRKAELSVDELERQRRAFRQLAASDSRFRIVSAEHDPETVARDVGRQVYELLAERTRRRHPFLERGAT